MARVTRAKAEKFLEELASVMYEIRTKHGIPQEDFICDPSVRIDDYVVSPDAFKNVSAQPI